MFELLLLFLFLGAFGEDKDNPKSGCFYALSWMFVGVLLLVALFFVMRHFHLL